MDEGVHGCAPSLNGSRANSRLFEIQEQDLFYLNSSLHSKTVPKLYHFLLDIKLYQVSIVLNSLPEVFVSSHWDCSGTQYYVSQMTYSSDAVIFVNKSFSDV